MRTIFDLQSRDFIANGQIPIAKRIVFLDRIIGILRDNEMALCQAMNEDFGGRHFANSSLGDIYPAINALRHARKHLKNWAKPKTKPTSPNILAFIGAKSQIYYQAKGVIGIISPWNFPINLSFAPMASAIAAGNRVMLKPSEFTPLTSQLIAKLIKDNFDENQIAVINGGVEIADEFAHLPFDHLLFTGATSIGYKIMAAAAKNLVPVTLELGGKSPAIITENFDLGLATQRIIGGKFMNSGQVCIAPDYLLVPENYLEPVINGLFKAINEQYKSFYDNDEYCAIINERHFNRLNNMMAQIKGKCRIIDFASFKNEINHNTRKIAPQIVINPPEDCQIMQDEIFGPILPIITYKNLNEAINYIALRPRPLALYYFDKDKANQEIILQKTISGGVTINDTILHIAQDELPFGGSGSSGMGAYHGERGFLEFSHQKAVFRQGFIDNFLLRATRPPYGKILQKYLDIMMRR